MKPTSQNDVRDFKIIEREAIEKKAFCIMYEALLQKGTLSLSRLQGLSQVSAKTAKSILQGIPNIGHKDDKYFLKNALPK